MKKLFTVLFLAISLMANDNSVFVGSQITAEGVSAEGQKRFAAMRAAKMDAMRNLLENLGGLKLTSETTVKDGMLDNDTIKTTAVGVLRGAKILKKYYNKEEGYAEVAVGVGFNKVAAAMYNQAQKDPQMKEKLLPHEPQYEAKSNMSNTPIYDGLIVDVTKLKFEPAMINRVYSDKKVVYDPSIVPEEVKIERGLASYTTSVNKAKSLLELYGSKNPMIIEAVKLSDLSSNVDISSKDADAITKSSDKNSFLESAKIVFILK